LLRIIKDGKNGFYESASGRRDKLEIMLDLLVISRQPIKKTHMLYNANLNFDQLERYLDMLQNMGLIEPVQTPFKGYKITNKGELIARTLNPSEPLNVQVSNKVEPTARTLNPSEPSNVQVSNQGGLTNQ